MEISSSGSRIGTASTRVRSWWIPTDLSRAAREFAAVEVGSRVPRPVAQRPGATSSLTGRERTRASGSCGRSGKPEVLLLVSEEDDLARVLLEWDELGRLALLEACLLDHKRGRPERGPRDVGKGD